MQTLEAYHLDMSRIRPEKPGPESTVRSVAADVLLRQEPDEEEDEGDRKEDDEDEDTDDGYSECGLNPSNETLAMGTLCRERNCEWQRNE